MALGARSVEDELEDVPDMLLIRRSSVKSACSVRQLPKVQTEMGLLASAYSCRDAAGCDVG
jgi:hypothetical protein